MFGSKNRARIAELETEVADLAKSLHLEKATSDALDRTAKKYRQERDDYRERLLRFTGPRERGAHGRFLKAGASSPIPGGAADVSPPTHRSIS